MAAPHLDPARSPAEILVGLDPGVRRLMVAVRELYAGSFEDCAEDQRRRQAGRPYLYRIDVGLSPGDVVAWLGRITAYEKARGRPLFDSDESLDLSLEMSR